MVVFLSYALPYPTPTPTTPTTTFPTLPTYCHHRARSSAPPPSCCQQHCNQLINVATPLPLPQRVAHRLRTLPPPRCAQTTRTHAYTPFACAHALIPLTFYIPMLPVSVVVQLPSQPPGTLLQPPNAALYRMVDHICTFLLHAPLTGDNHLFLDGRTLTC